MTTEQVEFFNSWKSIINGHYKGNGYSVEWNNKIGTIDIKRPTPHSNLCISICMVENEICGGVSIDLIDLDKADILHELWDECYITGYEFDNTPKSVLQSVEYLFDLIEEL